MFKSLLQTDIIFTIFLNKQAKMFYFVEKKTDKLMSTHTLVLCRKLLTAFVTLTN